MVYNHAIYCSHWNGRVDAELYFTYDRIFTEEKSCSLVGAIYIGYALGGILASLIGMYLIPHTDWRVLYYIGTIPLLTIPLFIKHFPESLSYYLAKKQVGKVVDILNKVKPEGNFTESDDYQLHSAQTAGEGFRFKSYSPNNRAFSTIAIWVAIFCTMMMAYGLNTWLPKMMQSSGFSITSSLSFNIMLCVGQIAGTLFGGFLAGKWATGESLFRYT